MRGLSTAFWSIVLLGSTVSIAAGFAGGRSIGTARLLRVPQPPADVVPLPPPLERRILTRALVGAHSLDAAESVDPYGDPDLGVIDQRPARPFDPRSERAQIVVLVVDAGRAGGELARFLNSPLPLTMVVAPADDGARATCRAILAAGKTVAVDASSASPGQVAGLVRDGADAVLASLDEDRATALMRALGRRTIVVDAALTQDDDTYQVARASGHPAFVRDVIADARDDAPYIAFMLRDALAIAERNGRAIVAVHARTLTFEALARFADRARRDGADLVPLDRLRR